MTNDRLGNIAMALANVAGAISERLRHAGAGALPPYTAAYEHFDRDVARLRLEGQASLADALAAIRTADEAGQ